ncbi:WD-40 repeat family protein / small nuclear ribonucleoprotein Prp4p-like protein [Wolffia australiana]
MAMENGPPAAPSSPTPPPPPALAPLPRPPTAPPPSTDGTISDREGSAPPQSAIIDEYEISEESRLIRERQDKARQELLLKRKAFAMAVPTKPESVRDRLRRLGEPVTLFGERDMERRDRLRAIMLRLDAEGQLERVLKAHEEEEKAEEEEDEMGPIKYPFFTVGSKELLDARMDLAKYSLARAAARLERARRRREDPDEDPDGECEEVLRLASGFSLDCSEIGDDRPLTGCSFSRDGSLLATSSWSGVTKIWSMPDVKRVSALKGHTDRATDVVFSPVDNCVATASADKTAKLWSSDASLLRSFNGHTDRLCRIAFHPSGKYLGTTSFDKSWRLWDVNTGVELLYQEGHSRRLYSICFHPDGSLAATCGLDALARVWDLRTGRSIMALQGHVKEVLGICFSPNGYHLATAGEDNTCRIWDLRKKRCIYIIPAHASLISQVKFEPQEGYFLATAAYDTKAMVWSAKDFKPVKTLIGHEGRVTDLDITSDGQTIATVGHDKTIKIWTCKNGNSGAMDVDEALPA